MSPELFYCIKTSVTQALSEDIGSGDITATLIDNKVNAKAIVISREPAIICGTEWVNEVFRQLDNNLKIDWNVVDGEKVKTDQILVSLSGNARHLLTGERTALNFLQTLSATATSANYYAQWVKGSQLKILDTRKTLPGLRLAQKYAVKCGGCHNHRIGLYDAFLIKENHITACGGIAKAIKTARNNKPDLSVEVEVETYEQLSEALEQSADIIMLDNLDNDAILKAVTIRNNIAPQCKLEVSGNIDKKRIKALKHSGIDYVSVGALTKHCKAIDLSMQFI